jgi:hypothetical protein
LSTSSAFAATAEEKCQSKRAKEAGKYQKCMQDWLSKVYKGSVTSSKRIKCRTKYAAAWPKLQALTGTSCDAPRWVDNGDGTVTDNLTGLIWEKKTDDGSVHDWDNVYTWSNGDADPTDEDGTIFSDFLATLNAGAGFAGANGWRLPTYAELQTILTPEPCSTDPCIDPIFGPFTKSDVYWSRTCDAIVPSLAWMTDFDSDFNALANKTDGWSVRAVRSGL